MFCRFFTLQHKTGCSFNFGKIFIHKTVCRFWHPKANKMVSEIGSSGNWEWNILVRRNIDTKPLHLHRHIFLDCQLQIVSYCFMKLLHIVSWEKQVKCGLDLTKRLVLASEEYLPYMPAAQTGRKCVLDKKCIKRQLDGVFLLKAW